MFADPVVFTINAVPVSLARVSTTPTSATYASGDGTYVATVKQTSSKDRLRHEYRLTVNKVTSDVLNPNVNVKKSTSTYVVVDEPAVGFNDTDQGYYISSLFGVMTTGIQARFLAGEM
jgi:hypothetical protein